MKEQVLLIHLPFSAEATPSMALSLLKGELAKKKIISRIEYANLKFLRLIGSKLYTLCSNNMKNAHMAGEFIFAKATGLPFKRSAADYFAWLKEHDEECFYGDNCNSLLDALPKLVETADEFIKAQAQAVAACQDIKLVGCTSTFFQLNSTIAFLRELKRLRPDITTLVGGANCMGAAAIALANDIEWIDYAFSGEADECFGDLVELLLKDGDAPEVALPYGAVKKGALRECMENPPCRITADVNKMAMPDFGDYFAALKENSLTETISPALTVEFSRGCWWGEKNACTFCGLNGSINRYRAKTSERVLAELTALKEKYSMTDFVLTDNILSYQHQKELLPKLKGKGYRFFSEVKSNLTAEGLADLKAAGFLWLQPGIESLQDDILRLMNKGNKAIRHVELLKNMREQGIAAFWGIIGGFPLEKEEWLEEMAELLPKLTHLQPPTSFRPMIVQRYNEYWRNPDKYNISLRPSPLYDFVCPDIENLAATLAYNFVYTDEKMQRQTLHLKLRGGVYAKISAQIAAWQAGFSESPDRLTMKDDGEKIEIMDLRTIAKKSLYTLTGKTREIYRRTKSAAAEARLIADFSQEEQREVKEEIEKLVADGLMIRIGGDLLALAVRDDFSPYDEKFPGRLLKRS